MADRELRILLDQNIPIAVAEWLRQRKRRSVLSPGFWKKFPREIGVSA